MGDRACGMEGKDVHADQQDEQSCDTGSPYPVAMQQPPEETPADGNIEDETAVSDVGASVYAKKSMVQCTDLESLVNESHVLYIPEGAPIVYIPLGSGSIGARVTLHRSDEFNQAVIADIPVGGRPKTVPSKMMMESTQLSPTRTRTVTKKFLGTGPY